MLNIVLSKHERLDLELETVEETPQTPEDIARGKGKKDYVKELRKRIASASRSTPAKIASSSKSTPAKITSSKMKTPVSGAGKTCSISKSTPGQIASASKSTPAKMASSKMKTPVPGSGQTCSICLMDDHGPYAIGVECDNNHFICSGCFGMYVQSESDIKENPQSVILRGGRIFCPLKISSNCDCNAFGNKLIAMIVSDERYEGYLRARDFVVGKAAIADALSKLKDGYLGQVEQEQIRNLYKKADGTYSAYMCGKCKFGPIDHGWCSSLTTHHKEKKGETGQINNACPKCNWFSENISSWPKWDGKFYK